MQRIKVLFTTVISMALLLPTLEAQEVNATELIQKMEVAVGSWNKLWEQKDVQFDYDYNYPQQGKRDVSQERYIFEGEHSWAKYTQHEINVMPGESGVVVQACVNNVASCMKDGVKVTDPQVIGSTDFLRRANYFWFTMMFKLNNPGTIHEYLGTETVEGVVYNKVKVSYESNKTGKDVNDAYILFLNPETDLVDQFYFSLPAMGVEQIALKMEVNYEEINGLKLPTKRFIYMPGSDGKLGVEPALVQTSTNIKFKNGFTTADLEG